MTFGAAKLAICAGGECGGRVGMEAADVKKSKTLRMRVDV